MTQQLNLFDLLPTDSPSPRQNHPSPEDLATIEWSYSRRSLLEKCLRCYYYEYYGANKRNAKLETNKGELAFLKKLQNRYERTGQILHLLIGQYFKKAQGGSHLSLQSLVSWAENIFEKDIRYSKSYIPGQEPETEKYPPTLLAEFYYHDYDALEKCQQAQSRLVQALSNFISDPIYSHFRMAGSKLSTLVEKPFSITGLIPCRVEGRIDLAFTQEENITIVDWKLGNDDGGGNDSLQLAVYALWATDYYKCKPEILRICKAHLGSNTITDFQCDETLLTAARFRILQDAEGMFYLSSYGQKASVDAFTPCQQPKVCDQCSFRKVCLSNGGRGNRYA